MGLTISRLARAVKRTLVRSDASTSRAEDLNRLTQHLLTSGAFDVEFYLSQYADIAASGMDPVEHYVLHGATEGRWPNAYFDSAFYLSTYADVADSQINPLAHFIDHGWKELRNPCAHFNTAWYWLLHMGGSPDSGNPLSHYLKEGSLRNLSVAPNGISPAQKRIIDRSITAFLASPHLTAPLCRAVAAALTQLRLWAHSEPVYRRLISLEWNVASHHGEMAHVLGVQGRWWQQIESLITATSLNARNANYWYQLAEAYEAMEKWPEAAGAYTTALNLSEHSDAFYRLGYALEKSGQPGFDHYYAKAISGKQSAEVKTYGVAFLHEKRGAWSDAARGYAEAIQDNPVNAQLHQRHGLALAKCYQWEAAVKAYRTALAFDRNVALTHYHLGVALERLKRWDEAAYAYKNALTLSDKVNHYWRYRQGYALMHAGDYLNACYAFIGSDRTEETETYSDETELISEAIRNAFAKDPARTDLFYALGLQHQTAGDWVNAAAAFRAAVDRSNPHRPKWYFALGYALFKSGDYAAACEAFRETRIPRKAYGVSSVPFEKKHEDMLLLSYMHYTEDLPIRERTIVYESFGGISISCNPLAIFRQILDDPDFADWTHIWVVDSPSRVPKSLRLPNVIFVTKGSDLYLRYLASASHLINNATFPYWFSRRPEQKYLNTWHGTPLKTLGKDIKNNFMEHKNTARNFLHATHIISPNAHTTQVLIDRYDLKGLVTAAVAETGYPRNDAVVNASEDTKKRLRERLGLDEGRPVLLYAPTWRGTLGRATVDAKLLQEAIERLSALPCQVVFRGHYYSEALIAELNLPVCIAPYDIDTSELLSVTDVLVTDYSSILFDFIPTAKPIVYFAYDKTEYEEHRGLYMDIDTLPGRSCETIDALAEAVSQALKNTSSHSEQHEAALKAYCPHDDGKATHRVIDFFFRDGSPKSLVQTRDDRKTLLFYAGAFVPNGITTSLLNLLKALDYSKYRAVVAIDPAAIELFDARMGKFSELPTQVQIIARVGRVVATPEEWSLLNRSRVERQFSSPEKEAIYLRAHSREFRRIFGDTHFDAVVQFEGYSQFWTAILAGCQADTSKIIYMHNDMLSEAESRFPALGRVFNTYKYYDALVSVSQHMSQINRDKLGEISACDAFVYAENVINHESILALSEAPLDKNMADIMHQGCAFVTMGRMSPEKDHPKLLHAFKKVTQTVPDARLIILGDGPMRANIEQLVTELGLKKSVTLAGQIDNPFPILKACDCFVLPSNHEGQPMVLLEAMVLGKPIIATDIDGNRGALSGRGGLLVDNSADGLAKGMLDYINGAKGSADFNANDYRASAIAQFEAAVSATQ